MPPLEALDWVAISSEHIDFVSPSKAPLAVLVGVVEKMEHQIEVIETMFGGQVPPGKLAVLFLDREQSGLEGNIGGVFNYETSLLIIVNEPSASKQVEANIAHELTHAVEHKLVPKWPRYLSEGLATYFETIQLGPDFAVVGAPSPDRLAFAADERPSLSALRKWNENADLDSPDLASAYGRVWLLTAYLIMDEPLRLKRMIEGVADGHDGHAVWRDGFGDLDDREVNARLQTFIVRGHSRKFRVPVTARVVAPDVRFLSLTERRVQTAQFFFSADELLPYDRTTMLAAARALVTSALLEEPASADARKLELRMAEDFDSDGGLRP